MTIRGWGWRLMGLVFGLAVWMASCDNLAYARAFATHNRIVDAGKGPMLH